jgi:hypothetical protein
MLKNEVSFYVLRNICFTKFQSLMRCGIILWGGASKTTKVLKLQKRVLCLMTNKYKTESCRPIFKELKILTVICLFIFESLCFFRKYNICQVKNLNLHDYETRNKDDFHILQFQTSLYKKSVINMSVRLYNRLGVGAQTRLIWLRTGTGGGLLCIRWWTFGFHKMRGISWVA